MRQLAMTEQQLRKLSIILQALANPSRLRIICLLQAGELPVNQISHCLGLKQSNVSHMLGKLTALGLVQARRTGRQVFYSVAGSALITPNLIERLSQRA